MSSDNINNKITKLERNLSRKKTKIIKKTKKQNICEIKV